MREAVCSVCRRILSNFNPVVRPRGEVEWTRCPQLNRDANTPAKLFDEVPGRGQAQLLYILMVHHLMVRYIMVHHLIVRYIVSIRHFLTLYSINKTLFDTI